MSSDEFPDDLNGDVLRRLKAGGDSLSRPRNIDFSLLFESKDGASKFVEAAQHLGMNALITDSDRFAPLVDVRLRQDMIPTHKGITDFEDVLEKLAAPFGGRNDGWGCLGLQD